MDKETGETTPAALNNLRPSGRASSVWWAVLTGKAVVLAAAGWAGANGKPAVFRDEHPAKAVYRVNSVCYIVVRRLYQEVRMGIYIFREAMELIQKAKKHRKEDELKKLILSKPVDQQKAYAIQPLTPEGKKY